VLFNLCYLGYAKVRVVQEKLFYKNFSFGKINFLSKTIDKTSAGLLLIQITTETGIYS